MGPPELPPLPAETILLVEVGSTAHGTGQASSDDLDLMGIVVESASEVLGLRPAGRHSVMERTQPDGARSGPGDIDRTLYPLRRFLRLASSGNPSILMCLWAPVIESTPEGLSLRELAPAFIGRHIIPRYRGYMEGQALRLLGLRSKSGHGRRGGGGRDELIAEHGYDTKYAMHCARLGFQCQELLTTGALSLPIAGESGDWLRAVRRGDIGFDEWWASVLELDEKLATMLDDERTPAAADASRIEEWSISTHLGRWRR
jgi:hypothetical protein